jgi:hypothetical protein
VSVALHFKKKKKKIVQVSVFLKLLESKTHFDKFLTFILIRKKRSRFQLYREGNFIIGPGILLKQTLNFKYKTDKKCVRIVPGTQEVVES